MSLGTTLSRERVLALGPVVPVPMPLGPLLASWTVADEVLCRHYTTSVEGDSQIELARLQLGPTWSSPARPTTC